MDGVLPSGPVVVYDDDHYYMGGIVAELLRTAGLEVTLATPANEVSTWTTHTDEQHRIQSRVMALGIEVVTGYELSAVGADSVDLASVYTEKPMEIKAAGVVLVTSREPQDALYHSMVDRVSIERIGDCLAPGTIATAVYAGHRYARELDAAVPVEISFRRE